MGLSSGGKSSCGGSTMLLASRQRPRSTRRTCRWDQLSVVGSYPGISTERVVVHPAVKGSLTFVTVESLSLRQSDYEGSLTCV